MRSELMAAIYDKALKRKDYSGIIDKEKQQEAAEKRAAGGADSPQLSGKTGRFICKLQTDSVLITATSENQGEGECQER
jgi:hypothetical protein